MGYMGHGTGMVGEKLCLASFLRGSETSHFHHADKSRGQRQGLDLPRGRGAASVGSTKKRPLASRGRQTDRHTVRRTDRQTNGLTGRQRVEYPGGSEGGKAAKDARRGQASGAGRVCHHISRSTVPNLHEAASGRRRRTLIGLGRPSKLGFAGPGNISLVGAVDRQTRPGGGGRPFTRIVSRRRVFRQQQQQQQHAGRQVSAGRSSAATQ